MLAEQLLVLDPDLPLWSSVRPLLDAALRLEQNDATYLWHGWHKQQINTFLQHLPTHCTLLVGVWEPVDDQEPDREVLVLGFVCEVINAEVCSLRTIDALKDAALPPVQALEPGFEHAHELMRVVKAQIAPVAWALFTDRVTWNEWVFAQEGEDKGESLAELARQGRCVLMGTQTAHNL